MHMLACVCVCSCEVRARWFVRVCMCARERERWMSPRFDLKEGSREVGQPKPKNYLEICSHFFGTGGEREKVWVGPARQRGSMCWICVAKTVAHMRGWSNWVSPGLCLVLAAAAPMTRRGNNSATTCWACVWVCVSEWLCVCVRERERYFFLEKFLHTTDTRFFY